MGASLRVLFATSEVSPLAKVGGLADVAGALPSALRRLGHDVRLAMPRYGLLNLAKDGKVSPVGKLDIQVLGRTETIEVSQTSLRDGTPVYLIFNAGAFGRPAIYGERDDLERFYIFSVAVAELPGVVAWHPQIVHCHDWHTGMTPPLWTKKMKDGGVSEPSATVFTIHNLGYQGWFDDFFAGRAGVYEFLPSPRDPIRPKVYSLMGLAILHADVVSTVSDTYAKEILTPEYGFGLEGALQRRKDNLYGILNGIDYSEFSPASDPLIPFKYDVNDLGGKAQDKAALQAKAGLAPEPGVPVVGMVGRLAEQKGIDLVADGLDRVMSETNIQFISLGAGEGKYRASLERAAAKHPTRVRPFFGFDLALAQLVYAGCDMYLMPSKYEPCGLGQMISMRYGTIPIVRHTGGLADTVQDCNPDLSRGTGFVFNEYKTGDMVEVVKRAAGAHNSDKKSWKGLVERAMKADFSWDVSATKYDSMYRKTFAMASSKTRR
ncbi:MAG: glycogen synthase [Chloroflexi bacterium]|nr:glycogen synthase [Chloroflexota bacterium]